MKHTLLFVLFFFVFVGYSQTSSLEYLDSADVELLFTDEVKSENEIHFSIFRVYPFTDELGDHLVVFTERLPKENDSIVAFCFRMSAGGSIEKLEWKITDYIEGDKENIHLQETAIWFWTKYLRLDDIDGNGSIDPIIVYGTSADNGIDDGRLKILVFLNGQKIGIRHQNSPMDFGRFTKVDASFYELSLSGQSKVKNLMKEISDANKVIFPAGWEEAMNAHKLSFDEN